jgi:phage terminase large subunit GpA-like protein
VIDRLVPLQHRPDMALPVAVMMIDSGDGNITDRAYEYARRMAGRRWLAWQRVHCLKGQRRGPHLSPRPTFLSLDTQGRRMEPAVPLHIAGVDGLKDDLFGNDAGIGYLAIEDGSPGQIFFARDFPAAAYDELFHEPKIEGDYIRNGPNETIDLLNYTECGRLLLEPDRKNIVWHDEAQRPLWAKPVPLSSGEGAPTRPAGADAAPAKPAGFFDKHRRLHENGT